MTVEEKIAKIMGELPAIGKDSKAPDVMGGFMFRGIEQLTGILQTRCAAEGIVFIPRVVHMQILDAPSTSRGGVQKDVVLQVEYEVSDGDDAILVGPIVGIGRDGTDKGANKAMTQAFKYAILQLFMISDKADDGDAQSYEDTKAPEPPVAAALDAAHEALVARIKNLTPDQQAECRRFRAEVGEWPLPDDKFSELSDIVTVMEAGGVPS